MINSVVLQASEIGATNDPNIAQKAVAGLFLLVLVYYAYKMFTTSQTEGMSREQERQYYAIQGQMESLSPTSGFIRYDEQYRQKLRNLFEGDGETTSVRGALFETIRIPVISLPSLERKSRWLGVETVVTAITGAVAFVSLSVWESQLSSVFSYDAPSRDAVVNQVQSILDSYPMWELLAGHLIDLAEYAYNEWVSVVIVLGAATVLMWYFEWNTEVSLEETVDNRLVSLQILGTAVAVLVIGILLNSLNQFLAVQVGYPVEIVEYGLYLLLNSVFVVVVLEIALHDSGLLRFTDTTPSEKPRMQFAYSVVDFISTLLSVFAIPFIVAYAYTAVTEGKVSGLYEILLSTPMTVRVVLVAALVSLVLVSSKKVSDELREAAHSWRVALSSKAAKMVLIGGALPMLIGISVGAVVLYFTSSAIISVLVGVLVVFVGRIVYYQLRKVKYGLSHLELGSSGLPARVFIDAYEMTDADGESIYVVKVHGFETYAHRDRDELIETVADDVLDSIFNDDGTPEPTVEENYWESVQNGLVEWGQDGVSKTRERIRERIVESLEENHGRLPRKELATITEYWPAEYYEKEFRHLIKAQEITLRRGGDIVVYIGERG